VLVAASSSGVFAQEDKKTDDEKPADPDTGESTVEESTLGLLPNPLQKYGIKFAATYIGETLGNVSGGLKQGAVYDGRLNLAVDVDLQKLVGLRELTFHANMFQIHGDGLSRRNLRPGWTLQPNFQYFVHPGGGATNPTGPNRGKLLKDAAVFGMRTVLKF
jgi:porin